MPTDEVALRATGASADARLALTLAYLGFLSLGLPDAVLGAAWPAISAEFGLPIAAAGAALAVATTGAVVSSSVSARVRARWGTGVVLALGTALAAGALITSALAATWALFLLAALAAGLGGGAIDASLNNYIAQYYSARHMNWLHACWGIGASLGPLVVASVEALGGSWRVAYGGLGAVEAALALSFFATRRLWGSEAPIETGMRREASPTGARWPERASVLMYFLYGGLETGAGLWATSFLIVTRNMSLAAASFAVTGYWAALCLGRLALGALAERLGPARVLRASAWAALLASSALTFANTPAVASGVLGALGFSLASIYPLTMHDTPRRFGAPVAARLVGQQVAAASLGTATLPWLIGALAGATSLRVVPMLLAALALGVVWLERARRRTRA